MAFRRRDVALSVAAALVAWIASATWIPALRYAPYLISVGAITGACGTLLILAVATAPVEAQDEYAYPPAASLGLVLQSWQDETNALHDRQIYIRKDFDNIVTPLDKSLDALLDLILREFVQGWYGRISAGGSFPNEVDRAIRLAFDRIAARLRTLDLVHLVVVRLLPVLDEHLDKFVEAEKAVRGKDLAKDASEEVDIAIAAKFNGGKVHSAAGTSNAELSQKQHLRKLVDQLLPEVLPDRLTGSSSVMSLMREIVACAVLLPAMQLFTDPDFLNQHIEAYGRAVLQERKTVKKLRAALDSATGLQDSLAEFPFLQPNDTEKTFELFIRAIRGCSVLHTARRVEGEVSAQIEDEGNQSEQDVTYLRRLEIGKRLLDQRIQQLSEEAAKSSGSEGKSSTTTLRDVLYDANGLSYMMEFMDRSDKMAYVQFWIVVDGLRNSSERIIDNTIEDQTSWTDAERQVINKINNNYFWRPEMSVPPGAQSAVNDFLNAGDQASLRQYNAARRAVLAVHAHVYQEMENVHFPAFKKSDLFASTGFPDEPHPATPPPAAPARVGFLAQESKPGRPKPEFRSQSSLATASALQNPDLRRAIASSSDLHSHALNASAAQRRSLDEKPAGRSPRRALFDDDAEDDADADPLTRSIASLDSDLDSPLEISRMDTPPIVHNVQGSLDDLVDDNSKRGGLFDEQDAGSSKDQDSERGSLDIKRVGLQPERPTLSSLGLLGTPSKRTVFNSDDLFGENEQLWEDEDKQHTGEQQQPEEEIRKAAPGDLGLAEVVQSLSNEISKLEAQQNIVKSMLSKAELTNNVAELRILRKSQSSLDREIRRKELQRQQYIVQENDNMLFGRASVSIKNIMVGTEPDGHEFALYVVEVTRTGNDDSAASWAVARRYSEFHDLHRRLRRRFARVREIEFPRRQMVLALQKEFLKRRRASLERYLRELLKDANICRSLELRAFLSQQSITPQPGPEDEAPVDRKDLVTRIYNSVSDGMEEFLGNVPIIDQLSAAGQNLIAAATTAPLTPAVAVASGTAEPVAATTQLATDPATSAEARRELTALEPSEAAGPAARRSTTLIAAMASAFLTLFQLRTSTASAWLRGRAVVIVLQQLLGGTVERRTRDAVVALTAPAALAQQLDKLREAVWPGGASMANKGARTRRDREKTRGEAGVVLAAVLMDVAGGVIGRGVAREAGRRVGRMIGNERVLRGLGYRLLDEFVDAVWGVQV